MKERTAKLAMIHEHYSGRFEPVRQNMLRMGEAALGSVQYALRLLGKEPSASLEQATDIKLEVDHWNLLIHDQCIEFTTARPLDSADARMIAAILETVIGLELIAELAYEMSQLAIRSGGRPNSQLLNQIGGVAGQVGDMFAVSLDSWKNLDREQALTVPAKEGPVRSNSNFLLAKLSKLTASPGDVTQYVNFILICKHLERMARLTVNVAERAALAAPIES